MGKSDAPLSFAELIEQSQRTPPPPGRGRDIASPFGTPLPPDHRVADLQGEGGRVPGVPEYDYEAHVDYFTLPSDKKAYEEVLNQILSAKAILRFEDRSFTKEGDCIVVICHLTYKPSARRAERLRREADAEGRDESPRD